MLKRVSIQNFKSLKDVTLDLQKVNLLIGPNNSGKTNFLKALEFVSRIESPTDIEVPDQLLFRAITIPYEKGERIYRRAVDEYITIHLVHNHMFDGSRYDHHKLYATNKKHAISQGEKSMYYILGGIGLANFDYNFEDYTDGLPVATGNFRDLHEVYLENLRIYKPDPNKFNRPGPVGIGAEVIDANALNLVGFLDLMLGKYRKSVFSRIEADIQKCLADFDEIKIDDVPSVEKELKEQFPDNSFKRLGLGNSEQQITYWADELSEGTLYFLALLCIINQPNPPKLLLLEEPERGIHPRRIWEVMDFIFRLAEEKDVQIILTTHNENVLNEFTSMPEAVFVFSKDEEGATYVKNLQKDIIEPSHQRSRETGTKEIDFTSNLGENWMYGLLGGVPEEIL